MKAFTGVTGIVSAAHRSKDGRLHGHTWEIKAWWPAGECAVELKRQLAEYLENFDHQLLGDEVAWGEALGKCMILGLGCCRVEVSRPLEGIFAIVEGHLT